MEVNRAHAPMISAGSDATGIETRNLGYIQRVIWFLRHGEAEEAAADDASRQLTEKGKAQAAAAGGAIAALGIRLDACLSSPKVRARDTASIACGELSVEVTESEALRDGDFDPAALAGGRDEALLVGHEPALSRAIREVTGARVKLKKGGLAGVRDGELRILLGPRELDAIAAGR
jgi:phosphohistidine phosphatase